MIVVEHTYRSVNPEIAMPKIESFFIVGSLIFLGVIIEVIRKTKNIPITILDLMFFPGSIFFTVVFCRSILMGEESMRQYNLVEPISFIKKLGLFIAALLSIAFGFWMIWIGVHEPLKYFSGVRGAAHGYTMVPVGILIFVFGVFGVIKSIIINFFNE